MSRLIATLVVLFSASAVPAQDWQGFYFGLGYGSGEATGSRQARQQQNVASAYIGYLYHTRGPIFGAELGRTWGDFPVRNGVPIQHLTETRALLGQHWGQFMAYGTAGYSFAQSSNRASDGVILGAGVEYAPLDRLSIGALGLFREYDDGGGSGFDREYWTFEGRLTLQF